MDIKNLKQQLEYVEHQAKTPMTTCAMYHRRHIFGDDYGEYHVIRKTAGIRSFSSLAEASDAISDHPDEYPSN